MRTKTKTRLSLIASLGVSLVAVAAASISTYAWFQSTASATVTTQSSSTTITVSKPDDFVFYGYKGNTLSTWPNKGNSFDDDFVTITSSNLAAQTSFNGEEGHANKFNPGEVKCFALAFTGHTAGDNVKLTITNLTSQTINDVNGSKHRYEQSSGSNREINIGWTIDAYSTIVTSLTDGKPAVSSYSTFATSQTGKTSAGGANGTDRIILAPGSNVIGKKGNTNVDLGASNFEIDLYPSTAISATSAFVFYSVVFREDKTLYCKEVDTDGGTQASLTPHIDANTRYFRINEGGSTSAEWNSNCYTDLTFALTALTFTF